MTISYRGDNRGFSDDPQERYSEPEFTSSVQRKIANLRRSVRIAEKNLITGRYKKLKSGLKIDYKRELNREQFAAATTINGPVLVIAGAGSGKTRTIVYRLAYMIENGIPPEKILLLTFTRKAAREMISRAQALLKGVKFGKVAGGTFHSFSVRIFRKYAKLLGISPNFTIADAADSADIVDLVRRELKLTKRDDRAFPRKDRIQEIISKSRNCNLSIKKVIAREFTGLKDYVEDIKKIAKGYARHKRGNNVFDFDDLMGFLRDCLKNNPEFRAKVQNEFPYVMVDEFQDTNLVQKQITDLIAEKHRNVMVVGDDSQSVYAFRGANFENILRFPQTYPECKYVKIEQNYRSTQRILDFTNAVIKNAKLGYPKKLFSKNPTGMKPQLKTTFNEDDEAEFVVSKILELHDKGTSLNQLAVLYRASHQGNFIQAELLKRDIPYVVYGGIKFVERRYVKDMIAYLRIILNPFDVVSWNRILQLIDGIGNVTASKIVEHIQMQKGKIDFTGFSGKKYSEGLHELGKLLNRVSNDSISIHGKIKRLMDYYVPILRGREDGADVRLEDFKVILELARKYNDLEQFLTDFALDPPSNKFQDRNTPRVDEREDKESLVLSTVHSAKGLEWHTVFVIHLLDGLFPSVKCLKDFEQLEEERRLFYVACTCAKRQLYLT